MTPTFFTDRDLGRTFPAILRDAGLVVREHHELFRPDTSDEEWIRVVATRDWIALTHDARIRYKPNEKAAVLEAGLGMIVLIGKVRHAELADNFVRTIVQVQRFVAQCEPPFIAKLYLPTPAEVLRNEAAPGRIARWL